MRANPTVGFRKHTKNVNTCFAACAQNHMSQYKNNRHAHVHTHPTHSQLCARQLLTHRCEFGYIWTYRSTEQTWFIWSSGTPLGGLLLRFLSIRCCIWGRLYCSKEPFGYIGGIGPGQKMLKNGTSTVGSGQGPPPDPGPTHTHPPAG